MKDPVDNLTASGLLRASEESGSSWEGLVGRGMDWVGFKGPQSASKGLDGKTNRQIDIWKSPL